MAITVGNACSDHPRETDGGTSRDGGGGTAGSGGAGGLPGSGDCPVPAWCYSCGYGQRSPHEACDDGNTKSGDGCSALCEVEANWQCPPAGPCAKVSLCGDGIVTSDEVCDDGNPEGGDGCSVDCTWIEPGWYCPVPGKPCKPDRRPVSPRDAGENCDGGGSGQAVCGNGIIEPGEECDDGSDPDVAHNEDGRYGACTTVCKLAPYCGDGIVNGEAENCDMGLENGDTMCTFACTEAHFCGDGIVDGDRGEECDLGSLNGQWNQGCSSSCRYAGWPGICYLCL